MAFGYSNDIQEKDLYECLDEDKSQHLGRVLKRYQKIRAT